jgi:hypothetical protein
VGDENMEYSKRVELQKHGKCRLTHITVPAAARITKIVLDGLAIPYVLNEATRSAELIPPIELEKPAQLEIFYEDITL